MFYLSAQHHRFQKMPSLPVPIPRHDPYPSAPAAPDLSTARTTPSDHHPRAPPPVGTYQSYQSINQPPPAPDDRSRQNANHGAAAAHATLSTSSTAAVSTSSYRYSL
ncbi:hypothetical protein MBM_06906 [Drepanopeziza brunnea f. sp. 'multigermtubi' MB_m1]|uniref:Uncharacterized protein n=1 Tax=Marssonina brunnea f. sp. multigermtubi (strain MB_m1) TaxID=1072389 RepID=K1WBK5_MARBU|nr:uncharacterized protein MBM_06906 [Drepanopeziza brunnea f. sp. 'multigermtubi' MB_m1]EKD14695.1 hypothetical protein MBM_06906 [Drepanopeziza brunnea f. sp. 'multigermtubi' MB_m1]